MRRAAVLAVFLCACGLTARGSLTGDGGVDDETRSDASATIDAGNEDAGGGSDATAEAAVDAGPCEIDVDDTFAGTTFDPTRWTPWANAANTTRGFPKPVLNGGKPTVKFLDEGADQVIAGLWHPQVVPFDAFDIGFDLYATCSNTSSCGDGLAIAFLTELTSAEYAKAGPGAILGIPVGFAGGAVALDLAEHMDRGEKDAPEMLVLDLNGTDQLTTPYDWVAGASAKDDNLINDGVKRIDISMRAKVVKVRVDGTEIVSATAPNLPPKGTFGFTAASGAFNAELSVGDLKAKFYRCNAP